MKSSKKIALAILLSILLGSLFTILAFTNLFSLIEAGLYYPIIAREIETNVTRYSQYLSEYHKDNMENKFEVVLKKDYIWKAYFVNQKADDIVKRKAAFDELAHSFPKQIIVRLIGPEGKRIHFSTLVSDITLPVEDNRINYKDLNKADPSSENLELKVPSGEKPRIILDDISNRFIYSFPMVDSFNDYLGTALVYLPVDNFKIYLLSQIPGIVMKEIRIISPDGILFDPAGLSSYAAQQELADLKIGIVNLWKNKNNTDIESAILSTLLREQELRIFYTQSGYGHLGLIVSLSQFAMSQTHKIIILTIFFFTTLLIIFLLFNLKQDPQRIVAERMHKFQLEFLREFLKNKEEIDFERWQHEIDIHRNEIKKYMKKGLPKLIKSKEEQLDTYIMNSWDEIVSFVKNKISKPAEESIELTRIEALIKQAFAEGKIVLANKKVEEKPARVGIPGKASSAVEQEEDIEELAEADLAEDVAELEEAEETGEAEAERERKPVDVEELTEAEQAEGLEELAEAEEAEAVAELEEADRGEKIAELGQAEAIEELENVEEEEGLEEVAESRGSPTLISGKEAAALKEVGIEELEAFPEITPLNPLPYEELEELPISGSETTKEQEETDLLQFEEMIKNEKAKCYTLKETMDLYDKSKTNVIFDQGVFRIKEELYDKKEKKKKYRGLKALADSIIQAAKIKEEKEVIGIDHLIKIDETFNGLGMEEETRINTANKIFPLLRKRMPLTPAGLDIDGYISQYRIPVNEKLSIQCFGELLKKLKAVCAAIFSQEKDFRITLAIGMDEYTKNSFNFTSDSLFAVKYLQNRNIISIKEKVADFFIFNNRISAMDKRYIKYAVFIPAKFNEQSAYLFIGFPAQKEKELVEILQAMDVYLK